ncbi:hypothetical protein D3C81_1054900 [compost metagenome]
MAPRRFFRRASFFLDSTCCCRLEINSSSLPPSREEPFHSSNLISISIGTAFRFSTVKSSCAWLIHSLDKAIDSFWVATEAPLSPGYMEKFVSSWVKSSFSSTTLSFANKFWAESLSPSCLMISSFIRSSRLSGSSSASNSRTRVSSN